MTLKKAGQVKPGDVILTATGMGMQPFRVGEVRTNPHYGWVGFVGVGISAWAGWFNPGDDIQLVDQRNAEVSNGSRS